MIFADLPQELRDLVFAFWSPVKEIARTVQEAEEVISAYDFFANLCVNSSYSHRYMNKQLRNLRKGYKISILRHMATGTIDILYAEWLYRQIS